MFGSLWALFERSRGSGPSGIGRTRYKDVIIPATGKRLLDTYPNGGFHVMAGSLALAASPVESALISPKKSDLPL